MFKCYFLFALDIKIITPKKNKPNPNNKPNVLNVGPGNIVHAKAFNTNPNSIEEIDKIIPLCFVIIFYVYLLFQTLTKYYSLTNTISHLYLVATYEK